MTLKIAAPVAGPSLSDLLAKLGPDLAEESDGWLAHCPAHADSHQSLRITVAEESGKIMLKDRAGCSNTKVMESLGWTIRDLAAMTSDVSHAHTTTSTNELPDAKRLARLRTQLDGYAAAIQSAAGTDALAYAAKRFGLETDDARRLGLGFARLVKEDRLVVPFRDPSGRPLGYQARALKQDAQVRWAGPPNPDGAAWTRIGWFEGGSGWEEVIVTEGPGDALTAAAVGYDALAIRGAGLVQNPHTMDQIAEWLRGRVAVVVGDGDAAGRHFAATLTQALEDHGVTVKSLPMRDGLDITDWRAEDPSWFKQGFAKEVSRLRVADAAQVVAATWTHGGGDVGAAYYLRDKLEAESRSVKFTKGRGFLQLTNGVWLPVHDEQLHPAIKSLRVPDSVPESDKLRKHLRTAYGVESVMKMLRGAVFTADDSFDRFPHLLAVRNGVIDLRNGELLPHDPSYLITRRVDVDYSPSAIAPRWLAFLDEIFPDQPELPAYLQRLTGYGITGSAEEQVFCIFYGPGATGKSTVASVLAHVFGPISLTVPFATFEQRATTSAPTPEIAALNGARLVFASEGEQGRKMAEATIKNITGGDRITARGLYKDYVSFIPEFLMFLITNHRPRFDGVDSGLWRRPILIEFKRHFAKHERDKSLVSTLEAEASGILAWAVQGAVAWYSAGKQLNTPDSVTLAVEEYRVQSDVLQEFVPGRWAPGPGRVRQVDLFHDFQDWAEGDNYRDLMQWSSRAFYAAMQERGFKRSRSGGENYINGLVRAEDAPAPDSTTITVGSSSATPTDLTGPTFE